METYIVTAKTVEEAYAIANREYADSTHEVSCEVIEMPKKGFLGLGSKEAKIKVTVTTAASAELSSVVADMRGMKKYTDRGGDGEQSKPQKKQNNQNNQKKPNDAKSDGQNQNNRNNQNNQNNRKQSEPQKQGQNDRNKQEKSQKPQKPQQEKQNNAQNKSEKPVAPAVKESAPAKENKPENKPKSALHNSARQNVRPQIKHVDGGNVTGASVTVGSPMGLTDFVSDNKQTTFGSSSSSGGSMSNDIRKKKPAKPMVSADKADEKLLRSKYDMAESDDDYKNIESMIRDDEAQLEKEAGAALGFTEAAAESEPAPAPRKREPITQAEMDYALEFANMLLTNMNLTAKAVQCECPEGEEFETNGDADVYPKIEIVGDDTGILIGHHGETLDAIQYLVNLSSLRKAKSKEGDYVRIVVDIENYREKRAETLRALARRMASKAVKYKRNVFLEPMNAYERRIIHSELQSYPDVSTHSVGTDRDRKIIITYEGADKQTDNRQHRRKGQKPASRPQKSEQASADNAQSESAERRRPRKIQKVPIEKLTDILDGNGSFLDGAKTEE